MSYSRDGFKQIHNMPKQTSQDVIIALKTSTSTLLKLLLAFFHVFTGWCIPGIFSIKGARYSYCSECFRYGPDSLADSEKWLKIFVVNT